MAEDDPNACRVKAASMKRYRGRSERLDINTVAAVSAQLDHQGLILKMVVVENLENQNQMVLTPRKGKVYATQKDWCFNASLNHQDQWDEQDPENLVDLGDSKVLTEKMKPPGEMGPPGEKGPDDGRNGMPGCKDPRGPSGENGKDGTDGQDAVDKNVFLALVVGDIAHYSH
uniref:Uncharacterized protein n=1 Tax=Parascaris univalens TaxID=6257 RepID=A0A915A4N5_PARUN